MVRLGSNLAFLASMHSPDNRHPMAIAAEWVSRITAIALEILVFIWLGKWLDDKLGTGFWAPIGLVVGPVLGFWHLLAITRATPQKQTPRKEDTQL
jgi:hypothetical protein